MSSKYTELLRNLRATFRRKGHNLRTGDALSHKGSAYKGKGNVNTDATRFNKKRNT